MLLIDGVKYEEWVPKNEEELERMVSEHAPEIFGENSMYFDRKLKLQSLSGIGSIPDGYAIVLGDKYEWHIIEVELSSHPLYNHIVPQIGRFITGMNNPSTRKTIIEALYHALIGDNLNYFKMDKVIQTGEYYKFISDIVSNSPVLTIVVEKDTPELHDALESLNHPKKNIVEFRTFTREGVGLPVHAHLFKPMFQPIGSFGNQKIIRTEGREYPKARGLKLYIKDGKHYNPMEALEALGGTLNRMVEGRGDQRATLPDGTILEYVGSTKNGKSKITKVHTYLLDHGFTFSQ